MPKPAASSKQPAAKPAKEEPKRSYVVLSNLQHDGLEYEPGEDVGLTRSQAEPLLGHTVKAKEGPRAESDKQPA